MVTLYEPVDVIVRISPNKYTLMAYITVYIDNKV